MKPDSIKSASLLPRLVAEEYHFDGALREPLGNGLVFIPFIDSGAILRSVTPTDLNCSEDELWKQAWNNLADCFNDGKYELVVGNFPSGESTGWIQNDAAASLVKFPEVWRFAADQLGADTLLAVITDESNILFMPAGCSSKVVANTVEMMRDIASQSLKSFGLKWFQLVDNAPCAARRLGRVFEAQLLHINNRNSECWALQPNLPMTALSTLLCRRWMVTMGHWLRKL